MPERVESQLAALAGVLDQNFPAVTLGELEAMRVDRAPRLEPRRMAAPTRLLVAAAVLLIALAVTAAWFLTRTGDEQTDPVDTVDVTPSPDLDSTDGAGGTVESGLVDLDDAPALGDVDPITLTIPKEWQSDDYYPEPRIVPWKGGFLSIRTSPGVFAGITEPTAPQFWQSDDGRQWTQLDYAPPASALFGTDVLADGEQLVVIVDDSDTGDGSVKEIARTSDLENWETFPAPDPVPQGAPALVSWWLQLEALDSGTEGLVAITRNGVIDEGDLPRVVRRAMGYGCDACDGGSIAFSPEGILASTDGEEHLIAWAEIGVDLETFEEYFDGMEVGVIFDPETGTELLQVENARIESFVSSPEGILFTAVRPGPDRERVLGFGAADWEPVALPALGETSIHGLFAVADGVVVPTSQGVFHGSANGTGWRLIDVPGLTTAGPVAEAFSTQIHGPGALFQVDVRDYPETPILDLGLDADGYRLEMRAPWPVEWIEFELIDPADGHTVLAGRSDVQMPGHQQEGPLYFMDAELSVVDPQSGETLVTVQAVPLMTEFQRALDEVEAAGGINPADIPSLADVRLVASIDGENWLIQEPGDVGAANSAMVMSGGSLLAVRSGSPGVNSWLLYDLADASG